MRLFVLALVRDEADRFFPSAIEAWSEFADEVIVLDDGSNDETPEIAREAGAEVAIREVVDVFEPEWPKRKTLWEIGLCSMDEGDYAIILDADMVPLRDPRPLFEADPEAVAFTLFDLWHAEGGDLFYRVDGQWRAHLTPRIWAFRRPPEPSEGWEWNPRGLHCGHLPQNFEPESVLFAPPDYALAHYAYLTPSLREEKSEKYLSRHSQLTPYELDHARSILDEDPRLEPLPFTPTYPLELNS